MGRSLAYRNAVVKEENPCFEGDGTLTPTDGPSESETQREREVRLGEVRQGLGKGR